MTGDRDEGAAQRVGHILDKARLPATGRSFQHDRYLVLGRDREEPNFPADLSIERLSFNSITFEVDFARRLAHDGYPRTQPGTNARCTINGMEAEDQGGRNYATFTLSRTSRTFCTSTFGTNGFCRNAVAFFRPPCPNTG